MAEYDEEVFDLIAFIEENNIQFEVEFVEAVEEITTAGEFVCSTCSKSYKTSAGLKRHNTNKHTESRTNQSGDSGTIVDTKYVATILHETQLELAKNHIYSESKNQIVRYVNPSIEILSSEINKIYKQLRKSMNIEKYFSKYYSVIVYNADLYFPQLARPYCALLAMKLGNKLLSKWQATSQGEQKEMIQELTPQEYDSLQYLSGYVVNKFIKKIKCSKNYNNYENQMMLNILTNMITDKSDQRLISSLSRGGLVAVNNQTQCIFQIVEMKFRINTNMKTLKEINITKMTNDLVLDSKIISHYAAITDTCFGGIIPTEISKNLLEKMIKLYLRVRSFSLTKDLATKAKIDQKCKKSKGLRKNIKRVSEDKKTVPE